MKLSFIVFSLSFFILSSCSNKIEQLKIGKKFPVILHRSEPHSGSGKFLAGAAEVKLTPWAGISMGGFGPLAKDARGYGLPLFAKAFYFEDESGNALVFVTADLWSMPAGLADSVAAIISHDSMTRHLGRDRFLFAGTHTHQSPGGFSSSVQYNTFASNWHYFDPNLFDFLVQRIAQAITLAFIHREPSELSFGQTRITGITRNRSMKALRNDSAQEVSALINQNNDLSYGPNTPKEFNDPDCNRGVDPTLSVLTIRSLETHSLTGILSFFACHPISMGVNPPLYSSDFFGYAANSVSRKLGGSTVVGIFNGAEGDVTSNYYNENWKDCIRLGTTLGNAIFEQATSGTKPFAQKDLSSHFEILPVAEACLNNECAAGTAELGAPGLGGSEESRTYEFVASLSDTSGCFEYDSPKGPISTTPGQPPKIPALSKLPFLQKYIMKMVTPYVPRDVPFGFYKIGDIIIVSLPGEFSTILGRRLKQKLAATSLGKGKQILFAGLSNEYLSYFTTPEEYDEQQYEGASMLFGKAAGKILSQSIINVAERFDKPSDYPAMRTYNPGVEKNIDLDRLKKEVDPLKELQCFLQSGQRYARVDWDDRSLVIPADWAITSTQINPELTFLYTDPSGNSISLSNKNSPDIITFVRSADDHGSKWSGFWLVPDEVKIPDNTKISVRITTISTQTKNVEATISTIH
jgi:neutral ceramidase